MQIKELRLSSFRNFAELSLKADADINLIYGANGAGKTSLLEALYVLGFGRSFRTHKLNNLTNHNEKADGFTIYLSYEEFKAKKTIGFKRQSKVGNVINIDGVKTNRLADIARKLPIQLFTPQSSELITGSPIARRRYIDWLVFHVEHQYGTTVNSYSKALAQRNSFLKNNALNTNQIGDFDIQNDIWTQFLVKEGEVMDLMREAYIEAINKELKQLYSSVFNSELNVEIRYNKGWSKDLTLLQAFEKNFKKDIEYRYTTVGPHKADLIFYVNNKKASEYLSRGQLRLLVSLLLVAEVIVLESKTEKKTLLLMDDIGAEMEESKRDALVKVLSDISSQLFITAIDKKQFGQALNNKNKKMFHVKHNEVYEE